MTSIETLINIEASDRSDVFRRYTSKNRELVAQGVGNSLSGLLGGLPITSVVVRTNLNISSGAQTQLSTVLHGLWLLVAAIFLANFLGIIPVASISAILLTLGWKMASVKSFKKMKNKGKNQFVPFVVTVLGIVFLNLLWGILIGLFVSFVYILRSKSVKAMVLVNDGNHYLLRFYKDVSFLNKPILTRLLKSVPAHSKLLLDGGHGTYIDADIIDLLEDFLETAKLRHIDVEIRKSPLAINPFFKG
jgi:carbonic anhydrase